MSQTTAEVTASFAHFASTGQEATWQAWLDMKEGRQLRRAYKLFLAVQAGDGRRSCGCIQGIEHKA
jgi:hypothetical protein